jgi:hypothetical protein
MRVVSPAHHMIRGALALVVFSIVYGAVTLALQVPEARGLLRRTRRR